MKKRRVAVLILIFVVLLSIYSMYFFYETSINKETKVANKEEIINQEDLININDCSEQFMEEYFEENKKINNKDNVLIVTSRENI